MKMSHHVACHSLSNERDLGIPEVRSLTYQSDDYTTVLTYTQQQHIKFQIQLRSGSWQLAARIS